MLQSDDTYAMQNKNNTLITGGYSEYEKENQTTLCSKYTVDLYSCVEIPQMDCYNKFRYYFYAKKYQGYEKYCIFVMEERNLKMKFSKVDNMRFAVVPSKRPQVTGKLYRDPKGKETTTLMAHVERRIEKASGLYNVLNSKNVPKGCEAGKNVDNFNKMLQQVVFQKTTEKQLDVLQNPGKYKDKKGNPLSLGSYGKPEEKQAKKQDTKQDMVSEPDNADTVQDFARCVVHSALKKGLRKYQDFVTELFGWFCQPEFYEENVRKPEHQEQIKKFLQALYEDCWKIKEKEHIRVSLEHQDVRVQVTDKDNQLRLALSSYCDSNGDAQKTADKAAVFRFLQEYAGDPKALQRLLREYVDNFFDVSSDEVKSLSLESVLPGELPTKIKKDRKNKTEYSVIDYNAVRAQLADWLRDRYRAVVKATSDSDAPFWYQRIQFCLEQYFSNVRHLTAENLTKGKLIRVVQGYLSHYIMGKYMDLGKAVYHFCNFDTDDAQQCGTVLPQYQLPRGITSFDYECIKAEEKLEKDLAVSLVYAIQNFRQNILQGDEEYKDILMPDPFNEQMKQVPLEKLQKQLLRYWGGASSVNMEQLKISQLAEELRQSLYFMRNYSFHYGAQQQEPVLHDALHALMQQDSQKYSVSVYQKYLNNNVFGFYKKDDVCGMIQRLHEKSKYTSSFVPAFASVLKRNQMAMYMEQNGIHIQKNGTGAEQFRSALYFVLKEIYYYWFLRDDKQVLKYFKQAFEQETDELTKEEKSAEKRKDEAYAKKGRSADESDRLKEQAKARKAEYDAIQTKQKAMRNFAQIVNMKGKTITFGQICQRALMTYALHNNTNYRNANVRKEKETFAHYKMILTKLVKRAFIQYMQENPDYAFLKRPQPVRNTGIDVTAMLKEFSAPRYHVTEYDNLFAQDKDDMEYAYYAMGKLLPPKQLNLLVGDLKNYQQFTADIKRRSDYADSSLPQKNGENFERLIEIMQFCLLSSGQISNHFEDYYQDKDDYAEYLRGFVAFDDSGQNLPYADLEQFCQSVNESNETNNHLIYVDGQNPVLYRGIELARMFGMDRTVRNALEHRVTDDDIKKIKKYIAKDLKKVLEQGECHSKKEQKALKQYQNLKQKVELNDIQTYSDLVFDLYSQLISWCYLYERDQMYLLLGYYYVRQYWPTEGMKDSYPMLLNIGNVYRYGKSLIMDGGITSQLGGTLYEQFKAVKKKYRSMMDKNQLVTPAEMQGGKKKVKLIEWFGEDVLAVEALMNVSQHKIKMENNNSFRNYVDHFEYFRKQDLNLLQLYQNAFYYMGYDRKLQHTVIRKLETILERYFLFGRIVWTTGDNGAVLTFEKPTIADVERAFGKLPMGERERCIPKDAVIVSKWLTYAITDEKTEEKEKVFVDAHTQKFCQNVHAILTYTAETKQK